MSKLDLTVKLHDYRPHDDIKRGRLQLLCNGEDCNEQFINAIGRIAIERLPMYAYANDLIKIERINPETGYHDSIPFNHDMMRLRLKNTPVMNIDPGFAILHERYWKNIDYRSTDREIHEKEKRIEVYIDAKNSAPEEDTQSILHVTTNDIKIFIDDEPAKIYSNDYPLLIISLNPKEAFKCSMKAVLGVGVNDTCWDACSNFCYDQETIPDSFIVKFQSASQFDEFTLIDRALEYFRSRTKLMKDEINRIYLLDKSPSNRFMIKLIDEDHTMAEPINYEIQSHKDIMISSCSKPDHLIKTMIINVVAKNKDKMLNAVMESMDNLIAKIDHFEKMYNLIDRANSKKKIPVSEKKITKGKK
jgi:DNA-directed RNA polymerase subunit L